MGDAARNLDEFPETDTTQIKSNLRGKITMLKDKLARMGNLEDGWLNADTPAPNLTAICLVEGFLCAAEKNAFLPSNINPSVKGGVGVTFLGNGNTREVFVEFQNSGEIFGVKMEGRNPDDDLSDFEIDPKDIESAIGWIKDYVQDSRR